MANRYTKYTIVTFDSASTDGVVTNDEEQFHVDIIAEITKNAEKTITGGYELIAPGQVKRYWVDQEAADAWKQFVLDTATKHNITVASVEIFDNTEDPRWSRFEPPHE
jgi:hypothetical protein